MSSLATNSVRSCFLGAAVSLLGTCAAAAGDAVDTQAGARVLILMGVGLVIGLSGSGDSGVDDSFVEKTIVGVLRHAGLDPWAGEIRPGRIAKVLVIVELPSGFAAGTRADVHVTAIGDATSLAGGTLLATPLHDDEGNVYAVGQGQVAVGNQIAGMELSEQSKTALRGGVVIAGAALTGDFPKVD